MVSRHVALGRVRKAFYLIVALGCTGLTLVFMVLLLLTSDPVIMSWGLLSKLAGRSRVAVMHDAAWFERLQGWAVVSGAAIFAFCLLTGIGYLLIEGTRRAFKSTVRRTENNRQH